jgi:hypothetical protein
VILSVVWSELLFSTPRKLFTHFSIRKNHSIWTQFSPTIDFIVCQYIIPYILISIGYYAYRIPPDECINEVVVECGQKCCQTHQKSFLGTSVREKLPISKQCSPNVYITVLQYIILNILMSIKYSDCGMTAT